MLEHGIGLIHHVGLRKKLTCDWCDKMIHPITDAFNNYEIGSNFDEFLLIPLIEGLHEIKNDSKCGEDFNNFTIALKKFSENLNENRTN
jgi:hypothetical protein